MKTVTTFSAYGVSMALGLSVLHNWKATPRSQPYLDLSRLTDEQQPRSAKAKAEFEGDDLFLTTVFDLKTTWPKKGTACRIGSKPSVNLSANFEVVGKNVAVADTKEGERVWFVRGVLARDPLELHNACVKVMTKRAVLDRSYTNLKFPKLTIDNTVELDDMIGMTAKATNDVYRVAECKQESAFKLNLIGMEVRVETKIHMTKSIPKPPKDFIVDGDFTVFVTAPNMSEPIFVAAFED
jgi:hypothetical protein